MNCIDGGVGGGDDVGLSLNCIFRPKLPGFGYNPTSQVTSDVWTIYGYLVLR